MPVLKIPQADFERVISNVIENAIEGIALKGQIYVLTAKDEVVSTLSVGLSDYVGFEITGLYTPPELRGRGHSSQLVYGAIQDFARRQTVAGLFVILFSNPSNISSNKMFRSLGFTPLKPFLYMSFR